MVTLHLLELALVSALLFVVNIKSSGALTSAGLPRPGFPLTVSGERVVDRAGIPFQFRCANWPGHMESMLPEGIQWAALDDIAALIVQSGAYNCIRLTYAADMWSIVDRSITARQSLLALNLSVLVTAIGQHNPDLLDMTLTEVQTEVVRACDRANIVVLFDNQVSKPMWCCS
jgi:endoglucanase